MAYQEATECFARLSSVLELTANDMEVIQRFVILMYDMTSPLTSINECRRILYTKKDRAIENIPPTENALAQHVKRALLQSYIWTSCLTLNLPNVEFNDWGWKVEGNSLSPRWMTIPEASKACGELKRCGCEKQCKGNCTCHKNGFNCTQRCTCGGSCYKTTP